MKIGIFSPWGAGDLSICTSVLKYRKQKWGDSKIIWFCRDEHRDLLKYNPHIDEIRSWNWKWADTNGEFRKIISKDYRLNNKHIFEFTSDLDDGYFCTPWLAPNLPKALPLAKVSQYLFDMENEDWHPCLYIDKEEKLKALSDTSNITGKKVLIENKFNSGQSFITQKTTERILRAFDESRDHFTFLFVSKEGISGFNHKSNCLDFSHYNIRQTIGLYNLCDIMIGVSSGISCATCSWECSPSVKRIEACTCENYSTKWISRGPTLVAKNEEELIKTIREVLDEVEERN